MTIPQSQLENPEYAAFAWGRYKRLMRWMTLASTLTTIIGLGALWLMAGPVPWLMMLFTALGIFFSVLLAAILMGLVFLSAGSGHDDVITDPFADIADK
jgi:hypothetical protein